MGLDSAYACLETLVASLDDDIWKAQEWSASRPTWQLNAGCICLLVAFGLVFATRMGTELLDFIDLFFGSVFLLIVVFAESIILNVDFGWKRL